METLTQYLIEYLYWALLVAALIKGPGASFVAGAMITMGYFNPFAAFGILAFKDLVLDTAFYALGRYGVRIPAVAKYVDGLRSKTNLGSDLLKGIEQGWQRHPVRLMWIGKLAYGLSAWFLVSAGLAGVPFKRFYLYTLPVTVFQFGVLMVLGYILGVSLGTSTMQAFTVLQLAIAGVVVFFGVRALARYIRKKSLQD